MIIVTEDPNSHIGRAINKLFRIEYTFEHLEGDLKKEIEKFDIEKWEPAQRGARITAMIKKCKTHYMLEFVLFNICKERGDMDIVLTPIMVRRLCKELFNRACSQRTLVWLFGGRMTSKATQEQHDLVDSFVDTYHDEAVEYWSKVEAKIQENVAIYRKNVIKDQNK